MGFHTATSTKEMTISATSTTSRSNNVSATATVSTGRADSKDTLIRNGLIGASVSVIFLVAVVTVIAVLTQ